MANSDIKTAAFYEERASFRPNRRPPRSPSRRQPWKNWYLNSADILERQMQAEGVRTWGYVIYRTTYASEDDWTEFLRRLRLRLEEAFEKCNGRDILDQLSWTIFSDKDLFDGADTASIRAHFRQWAETARLTEQQPSTSPPQIATSSVGRAKQAQMSGRPPRYEFCIQVDEAALHSVVYDAPAPPAFDLSKKGWVKLISKSWIPIEEDPRARPGYDNSYEPVEGITERDVGWMKVPYYHVMTEYYIGTEGLNGWRAEYCRPPAVAGESGGE